MYVHCMQSEKEKTKLYPALDDFAKPNFDVMLGQYPDKLDKIQSYKRIIHTYITVTEMYAQVYFLSLMCITSDGISRALIVH